MPETSAPAAAATDQADKSTSDMASNKNHNNGNSGGVPSIDCPEQMSKKGALGRSHVTVAINGETTDKLDAEELAAGWAAMETAWPKYDARNSSWSQDRSGLCPRQQRRQVRLS